MPALSSKGRAYAAGRLATLRPPSPINAYRLQEQLAKSPEEIRQAYAAGVAADPRAPLPGEQQVLAQVVARMDRQSVEELGGEP